jgi:hypothetical protein
VILIKAEMLKTEKLKGRDMITKKEQAAAVLLGCISGMGIVAAVIAAGWVGKHYPVEFWAAVCWFGGWSLVFFAMLWMCEYRAWRRRPRPELWACTRCGKLYTLYTLDKLLAHRCQALKTGEAKGVRPTIYQPYQEAWMSGGDRQILDCPRHAHSTERRLP